MLKKIDELKYSSPILASLVAMIIVTVGLILSVGVVFCLVKIGGLAVGATFSASGQQTIGSYHISAQGLTGLFLAVLTIYLFAMWWFISIFKKLLPPLPAPHQPAPGLTPVPVISTQARGVRRRNRD